VVNKKLSVELNVEAQMYDEGLGYPLTAIFFVEMMKITIYIAAQTTERLMSIAL
jgi:hypothetical protein